MEHELDMVYGAKHVILLFIPVTICMVVVMTLISTIKGFGLTDEQTVVLWVKILKNMTYTNELFS